VTEPRADEPCPDENALTRFVSGEGSKEARASIEAHVDRCATCGELLAQLAYSHFDAVGVATLAAPSSDVPVGVPAPGAIVGQRYELGPRIGKGGMGEVYAARDPTLRRPVAIKILNAPSDGDDDRALREARAMARVAHPNVVTVYDAGHFGPHVFIAMELVRGPSLRRYLELHPEAPFNDVLALFVGAGLGLAAAHAARMIHRDFKPENVLVDVASSPPRARVTDFGLAQPSVTEAPAPLSEGEAQWMLEAVTRGVGGTPAFMSPEQWGGQELDARSDQFSFAVAFYQALYRRHPFLGARRPGELPRIGALREAMERGAQPPPESATVPSWVWPILQRALKREPSARWPSMDELVRALEQGEARRAEWHIGAHVAGLAVMCVLHVFLVAAIPIGLAIPDDPSDVSAAPHWIENAVGVYLAILVGTGWAPAGIGLTALSAYGMFRRSRWAYISVAIYAATALFSCVGTPYAIFAIYSLTRREVRAALGRS
jgi:hypothetical protein